MEDIIKNDFVKVYMEDNPDIKRRLNSSDGHRIMELYRSKNPVEQSQATLEMICGLHDLIISEIEKKAPMVADDPDAVQDMQQECYETITKGMSDYDPNLAAPSTYFLCKIQRTIYVWYNEKHNANTIHYVKADKKIRNVENQYAAQGMQATIEDIARETGFSALTIQNTKSRREMQSAVNIEDAESSVASDFSPEEQFIKSERSRILRECLDTVLDEYEKKVIEAKFDDLANANEQQIADSLGISVEKVNKLCNSALDKLQRCDRLKDWYRDVNNKCDEGRYILNHLELNIVELSTEPIDLGFEISEINIE